MRLLVDNTLVHRVGKVVDSGPEQSIRAVDAVALFHMAEHILFSDEVIVSSFERTSTCERTCEIIDALHSRGFTALPDHRSLVQVVDYADQQYTTAVSEAAWGVLDELSGISARQLKKLGHMADEATRPGGIEVPSFDQWASEEFNSRPDPERLGRLMSSRAEGAFELMILQCSPLLQRLRYLRREARHLSQLHSAALTVLLRLYVNQELARQRSVIYSPAPQRSLFASASDLLYRQRLAKIVVEKATDRGAAGLSPWVERVTRGNLLPLPVFAFHVLRDSDARSPQGLLSAARQMRDDPEIVAVRSWLSKLEQWASSDDLKQRQKTEAEMITHADDIGVAAGTSGSIWSSFQLGGEIKMDAQRASWKPPAPSPTQVVNTLLRRFDKRRRFLAAVTRTVMNERDLGARILKQIGRSVS